MYDIQEIQSIALKNSFNTHNKLYQTKSNIHPILRENSYTDINLRNKTLKDRLLERRTDDAVTLPIHEFKYERCLFHIYIYIYNVLRNLQSILISQG